LPSSVLARHGRASAVAVPFFAALAPSRLRFRRLRVLNIVSRRQPCTRITGRTACENNFQQLSVCNIATGLSGSARAFSTAGGTFVGWLTLRGDAVTTPAAAAVQI